MSGLAYDLRPGDHLVYKQTLTSSIDNNSQLNRKDLAGRPLYTARSSKVELTWENHVLVLGAPEGGFLIGIQRNLKAAAMLESRLDGKDLTEDRQDGFRQQALSLPPQAEANLVDRSGRALLPWEMRREWNSKVLFDAHEILPLPQGPLAVGLSWTVGGFREYSYEVKGRQDTEEGACLVAGGKSAARSSASNNTIRTSFLYCPSSQLMKEFFLESLYLNALFSEVRDTVRLEFVERRRDESAEEWLANPEVRLAYLQGLLTDPEVEIDPDRLGSLLQGTDPEVQKLVLAVLFQRGLGLPADVGLEGLRQSQDARVRELAERLGSGPDADNGDGDREMALVRAARFRPGAYPIRIPLGNGETWPAIVQVPLDYQEHTPAPLVIYLSGNGGPAVEGLLIGGPAFTQTGYLVVYPQADGYWWDDAPTEKFDRLLTEILKTYNVDPQRIYLTGLSNGGTGALFYAALWPHRFTAVVPAMGAGFGTFDHPDYRDIYPENLASVPLLFLHGEQDRTIPAELSRESVRRLRRGRTAPLEQHYFAKLGHGVVIGRGDEGRTIEFFRRFASRPRPRQLHFKMDSLDFPRHFWVELLAIQEGIAEVRAEIEDDNTIRIRTKRVERFRLLLREDLLPHDGPVRILLNGDEVFSGRLSRDEESYRRSLEETGDPLLAYTSELEFDLRRKTKNGRTGF